MVPFRGLRLVPSLRSSLTSGVGALRKYTASRLASPLTLHPGSQVVTSPPRVRDFEFSFVVDGQDGRLAWGHSLSTAASTNEPFAWAISADNKSIIGADTDGYFQMTILSPDRIEMCYAHNGLSPSGSMVATCYVMERAKK